ncbi:endonuclease domain-containing protein [Campylobacter troglodytis]|uniref:endonuclease domain-containing protein n=1 Tax=Campylobacter troglodytis TaxID=654363 RepID=UPI0011580D77|nr:DUF559 domain-containing protein [Campylobacter troglodytis]TQR60951.1 hypothetical protein DMC01_03295 [Campylobacter troglodytis]
MSFYPKDLEEERLKQRVANDFFAKFVYEPLERVDFTLKNKGDTLDTVYLLWAEAKAGNEADIYESFVQLILTIGVQKIHKNFAIPEFLGAFDCEKIAFLPYKFIKKFLYSGDFNWKKITPSDYKSPEFQKMLFQSKDILKAKSFIFDYEKDNAELKEFIKNSIAKGEHNPIEIDADNFDVCYLKWSVEVLPTIRLGENWEKARKANIALEQDFFLADLISEDNVSLKENLRVLLQKKQQQNGNNELYYEAKIKVNHLFKQFDELKFYFISQKAHDDFWKRYKRPPEKQFWNKILERRDKLTPQDIMERKGAFFTPPIWVTKAQEYLAATLGKDWQDEYYIWDCAAGTGNLLKGLTHSNKLYASTLDLSDVLIMKDLCELDRKDTSKKPKEKLNLLENHIFEFDFLNDEFFDIYDENGALLKKSPLPQKLQDILRKLQKSPSLANGDTKSESGDTLNPLRESDTLSPPPLRSVDIKSPPPLRRGVWGVGEKTQNTEKSHRPLAPYMKEFSRAMRKNPTDAENKLWQELRNKKLGFSFRRQFVIDSKYIADFVCLEKRLIIECDGGQHNKSPSLADGDTLSPPPLRSVDIKSPPPLRRGVWGVGEKTDTLNHPDIQRDFYLESQNFRILRFWNNEILENLEGVLNVIKEVLQDDNFANAKFTHPQTPSAREGALPLANSTLQSKGTNFQKFITSKAKTKGKSPFASGANQKSPSLASENSHDKSPSLAEGDLGGGYFESATSQGASSIPKLIIFINPPYAEVSSKDIQGKKGVNITKIHAKYKDILQTAGRELFAQFFMRIYKEIPNCILASFSKLKYINGNAFVNFRKEFKAEFKKGFISPADTFDNVKGQFPIGFLIWNLNSKKEFKQIQLDIFERNGEFVGKKGFYNFEKNQIINKWINLYRNDKGDKLAWFDGINSNDFQHNNIVYIVNEKSQVVNPRGLWVNSQNLIPICVYFSVRHAIKATWLNDRDQFLYPNEPSNTPSLRASKASVAIHKKGVNSQVDCHEPNSSRNDEVGKEPLWWGNDLEFQNDCLAFTLFHSQNRISSKMQNSSNFTLNNPPPTPSAREGAFQRANSAREVEQNARFSARGGALKGKSSAQQGAYNATSQGMGALNKANQKSPSLAEGDLGGGSLNSGLSNNINHFIPFNESEVNAKEAFKSDFMVKFMSGKLGKSGGVSSLRASKASVAIHKDKNLKVDCHEVVPSWRNDGILPFDEKEINLHIQKNFIPTKPLEFSIEAKKVFDAGREIWLYYHNNARQNQNYNANASLYDIKEYFQGRSEAGKMNAPQKAADSHYKDLIGTLNLALKELATKITPKIYEYGFLRE